MPKLPDLINGFKMLKEVDIRAIRTQAETPLRIMVIGQAGAGKSVLIEQLHDGPRPDDPAGLVSITMHRPIPTPQVPDGALVLLMLDARRSDFESEHDLFDNLCARKIDTIVCYNKADMAREEIVKLDKSIWNGAEIAVFNSTDRESLLRELVPSMLRVCKGRETQLARHIPMLREPVARKLIDDTCIVNATYSLGTGMAEMVPVLDLPLNLADIIILTKNQAMMAYTISLAMGMEAEWRDSMPKMAAVVGSAFFWRQLARYLSGLVPVIGVVPKVVVAYAGTYVIGEAIYQWCVNGEKLSQDQLKAAYAAALEKGSDIARDLIKSSDSAQQQVMEKFKEVAQTVSERTDFVQEQAAGKFASVTSFFSGVGHATQSGLTSVARKFIKPSVFCKQCGRKAPQGASFCAYCGKPLT